MDIFRAQFGARLGKALANKGLKQNELAEKLDVKSSTVSRWVNGHDFPEDRRLPDLCRELGVTIDYFREPAQIVHHDPLPEWTKSFEATLESKLSDISNQIKEVSGLTDQEKDLLSFFRKITDPTSKRNTLDQVKFVAENRPSRRVRERKKPVSQKGAG